MTQPHASTPARALAAAWPDSLSRYAAAGFAAAIGVLLLYVVGFSPPQTIHEAAHDARHAAGFPCH